MSAIGKSGRPRPSLARDRLAIVPSPQVPSQQGPSYAYENQRPEDIPPPPEEDAQVPQQEYGANYYQDDSGQLAVPQPPVGVPIGWP